jgi:hypothetical protein
MRRSKEKFMADATEHDDPPFEKANPYVAAAKDKLKLGLAVDGGGGPRKLQTFVGFLDADDGTGTRRLYFTHKLNRGVDIPVGDIVYGKRLPARRRDGLIRDYVVVRRGRLLFWSEKPLERTDPKGGTGGFAGGPF